MYGPSLVTGPTGTPIVLCSHHFWRVRTKESRGDRKKGPGSDCRDAPWTSQPLVGVVFTQKTVKQKRRSSRLETGVSCHSSGIVTKQPSSFRGALYRYVFRYASSVC